MLLLQSAAAAALVLVSYFEPPVASQTFALIVRYRPMGRVEECRGLRESIIEMQSRSLTKPSSSRDAVLKQILLSPLARYPGPLEGPVALSATFL